MGAAKFLALVFLSILIIPLILGFVISYSIDRNMEENIIDNLIKETAEEVIDENIDVSLALELIKERCISEYLISAEDYGIEINCSEINEMNDEGLRMFIENSKEQLINNSIDKIESPALKTAETKISSYLQYTKWGVFIFGALSIIMIIIIFLISGKFSKFFIVLGLVGMITGFFSFFVRNLKNSFTFESSEIIEAFVINIMGTAQRLLFSIMLAGIIIFGMGLYFSKFRKVKK